MAVTSIVRDRGRAFGVAIALATSAALLAAPAAFGAVDGDPIATSTLKVKFGAAFKNQLAQNGVKMKAKGFKISKTGKSDVDPTTGQADLRLGKIVFKKGKKKVAYGNLKGSLPGKLSGSAGKLFKLTAPTVARNSWGADISGVKIKFLKAAAKKINKKLELNSLRAGNAGTFALSYQPKEVKILSGQASTAGAIVANPPSVGIKFLSHCVSGLSPDGISPIEPATQPGGPATTFFFPVVGGDIAPDGANGLVEQTGGVRINNNNGIGTPAQCAARAPGTSQITQVDINVDITARTVSSVVNIVAAPAGVYTGDRGRAVNQLIDPANTVVTSDPANKTITLSGSRVLLAPVSAGLLNLVFPQPAATFTQGNEFADSDFFGTSMLTVTTR